MDVPRVTPMRIGGAQYIDFAFLMILCLLWNGRSCCVAYILHGWEGWEWLTGVRAYTFKVPRTRKAVRCLLPPPRLPVSMRCVSSKATTSKSTPARCSTGQDYSSSTAQNIPSHRSQLDPLGLHPRANAALTLPGNDFLLPNGTATRSTPMHPCPSAPAASYASQVLPDASNPVTVAHTCRASPLDGPPRQPHVRVVRDASSLRNLRRPMVGSSPASSPSL